MLFTELKTQNNEIDSILEESHWVLLIPGLKIVFALAGNTDPLDLGSVYRLSPGRPVNNCRRASLKSMLYTDHYLLD